MLLSLTVVIIYVNLFSVVWGEVCGAAVASALQ